MYKECYIRFSAKDYDEKNINNLFIHLTNNSISKNCQAKQSDFFAENMWSLDNFKTYLTQHYGQDDIWQKKLLP
jgi:hypothetical protein